MMDLTKLSLDELQALLPQIESEIADRRAAERSQIQKQIVAMAERAGLTVNFNIAGRGAAAPARAARVKVPVAPKYQHPKDASLTWAGRGKPPKWVVEFKAANGGSLDGAKI